MKQKINKKKKKEGEDVKKAKMTGNGRMKIKRGGRRSADKRQGEEEGKGKVRRAGRGRGC